MRNQPILLKLRMLLKYHAAVREWYHDVWKKDAWERMCCDGHMCGCYGSCNIDWWEHLLKEPSHD